MTRTDLLTPFLDLHERAGGESKGRFRLCLALDMGLRLVVCLLLLAIIGLVAWKTLAPFPSP